MDRGPTSPASRASSRQPPGVGCSRALGSCQELTLTEPAWPRASKARACLAVARPKGERRLAPQPGLEPGTLRLTAGCSTIELLRNRQREPLVRGTLSVTDGRRAAQAPLSLRRSTPAPFACIVPRASHDRHKGFPLRRLPRPFASFSHELRAASCRFISSIRATSRSALASSPRAGCSSSPQPRPQEFGDPRHHRRNARDARPLDGQAG